MVPILGTDLLLPRDGRKLVGRVLCFTPSACSLGTYALPHIYGCSLLEPHNGAIPIAKPDTLCHTAPHPPRVPCAACVACKSYW